MRLVLDTLDFMRVNMGYVPMKVQHWPSGEEIIRFSAYDDRHDRDDLIEALKHECVRIFLVAAGVIRPGWPPSCSMIITPDADHGGHIAPHDPHGFAISPAWLALEMVKGGWSTW